MAQAAKLNFCFQRAKFIAHLLLYLFRQISHPWLGPQGNSTWDQLGLQPIQGQPEPSKSSKWMDIVFLVVNLKHVF